MKVCGREIKVEGRLIRTARLDGEKYEFLNDPEVTLNGLRDSGARIDLFTFMQRLSELSPLHRYPMEWDNLAVLPVSTFDVWWNKQVDAKTRNMVRKAEKKGVHVRETPFDETLVRGIWEIYNECPIRQGKPFPHYGKDLLTVHRAEATYLERSIFLGAFLDEKLVGFVKLVSDESGTQAGLMNIVSMIMHRDKAPTNALIAQAVRTCAERGIPNLVYANFSYGRRHRDSLSDFKRNNGFQQIDVPRYYVPLTSAGRIALRLGFHRRLVDRLPEAVIVRFRNLRHAWYSRKLQSASTT
ncbi:MAG TPA: hypothetical protein VEI01_16500 [Terriglobales bacterium]|nr:hypothetical protein [Terriglobales bacterium]